MENIMTALSYLAWHFVQLYVYLFAGTLGFLALVLPTSLADPHVINGIQWAIAGFGILILLAVMLRIFFPVPKDYQGILDS